MLISELRSFRKLVFLSIVLIYLVILAGGIVRSTGSGMGCPDWPKCFGMWAPPTHISQLPSNYKELFKVGNHTIADFNVFKTWVEYVNRLLGVLVGFSVFATLLYSFRFINKYRNLFLLSLLIVLLTGLQGWIGAKVVATNLSKYMITIHMLIALVIVSLALYLFYATETFKVEEREVKYPKMLLGLAFLTLVQILIGTQVRQEVDTIAIKYNELSRQLWIGELGAVFSVHRVIALIIVFINGIMSNHFIKTLGLSQPLCKIYLAVVALLVTEYAFGLSMVWFDIPFFAQPFHLFLATLVFGLQFYAWLLVEKPSRANIHLVSITA